MSSINAQCADKLIVYSGSEKQVCAPDGYGSPCERLSSDTVHSWIEAGEVIQRLPVSEVRFGSPADAKFQVLHLPSETIGYLHRYKSDKLGTLDASYRMSALFIIRWAHPSSREFGVTRSTQHFEGKIIDNIEYRMNVGPDRENYYHAIIDDIDPEKKVEWFITSNGQVSSFNSFRAFEMESRLDERTRKVCF